MSVAVEILVRADPDRIWRLTQDPALHQRWDLRFSRIAYAERAPGDEAQRFGYERSLLPGVVIRGWGETRGERHRPDGLAASALSFGSEQRRSLIREGSGYWRYAPTPDGVLFSTRYDYTPRWGLAGRALDRLLVRRLMAWGTAWSFDRLRLWAEQGKPPERWWRAPRPSARRCTWSARA